MRADSTKIIRTALVVWAALLIGASAKGAAGDGPKAGPAATLAAPVQSAQPVLAKAAPAVANSECMDCHEAEFKPRKKGLAPEWIGVKPEAFARSMHGKLNCVDCHTSITETPHDNKLPAVQCAACHANEDKAYSNSIHGMSHAMGASAAATCASCHGNAHEVASVKSIDSPVFKLNLPETCAKCHSDAKLIAAYRMNAHTADFYKDSIHGQALIKMKLIVAP